MTKRIFVEVSCDGCGNCDYYPRGGVDSQAESQGWIIVGRKHFCDESCRTLYNPELKKALEK